jgi:hypothetical protein
MGKLLVIIGATFGGWLGWWLGELIGIMTAYFVSLIGMALGVYAVKRFMRSTLK